MIGYYIHHQGAGHLHRATTLAQALPYPVTGLSSLPRPVAWPGEWVELDRDDDGVDPCPEAGWDIDAGGALHWAPRHHPGLRCRSAQISAWLEKASPDLLVADVSVEVALLARLHGIPVVSIALPGCRTDPPHQLGYAVSEAIIGMWPPEAETILEGVDGRRGTDQRPSFFALGGLSRFAPEPPLQKGAPDRLSVVVLNGRGGAGITPASCDLIARALPEAELTVLGGGSVWQSDPWPALQRADVVVTAAGQNSIAEVAASRTPAVVMALPRPHSEQHYMRDTLLQGPWPVLAFPEDESEESWRQVLQRALRLDGSAWVSWCDGGAAGRFTATIDLVRSRISREVVS